jgi:hexosaminidase
MSDLMLLPIPVRCERSGGEIDSSGLAVREVIAPEEVCEAGGEAYRLVVDASGARIAARTATGLRWGRSTLDQLRRKARIPCLVIDDAPRFAHRGVMLDISRDRMPTMATLFALVDHLAAWKMNHLQLYIEHALAYLGHDDVWRSASPITLEELSALDAYCTRQGIALNANQNCLGHFDRWLKHPRYAPLAEMAGGHMVHGGEWYVRPNTLCPIDPRVQPFLEDLLSQQLPRCSGDYANIGCDEPWDLGVGRNRANCETRTRGAVFSEHVAKVAAIVRRLGKKPQFWCDPNPNEVGGLPQDLIALVWGYEDTEDFHSRTLAHRSSGREVWVAPGTSCWNSSTGRTWNRRGNLDLAVRESEAVGFLSTAWGDGGHRQQWPITLFGFADSAMAAWSGPGHYDDLAAGMHAFGCAELGPWLTSLGNVDAELCRGERRRWDGSAYEKRAFGNSTALWRELHAPFDLRWGEGDTAAWEEIASRLDSLLQTLPSGLPDLLARECRHSLAIARWTCDRAILRRGEITSLTRKERKEQTARFADCINEYRELWLARSRYGGLEESCLHYWMCGIRE